MPGLVDHAHAAPTQFLEDLVIAQHRRHFRRRGRILASAGCGGACEDAANGRVGREAVKIVFQDRFLARSPAVPDLDCQELAEQFFPLAGLDLY